MYASPRRRVSVDCLIAFWLKEAQEAINISEKMMTAGLGKSLFMGLFLIKDENEVHYFL
jgi:hypothetical protein